VSAAVGEMPPTHLANPSPKRKREQPPLVPLLNTTLALRPASTPPRGSPAPSSGADSPRNAVADQLRGMTLAPVAAIPMSPLTPTDDAIRKRPKLDAMRINSDTSLGTHAAATAAAPAIRPGPGSGSLAKTITFNPELAASREIPETPQAPRPRIVTDIAAFAQPTTFMSSRGHASSWQSPPKKQAPSLGNQLSPKPHSQKLPKSPPLSALTWHDDEITGHLTGPMNDPDDDGTGLNGLGFKPTPAMAYQRSQKRRQQLSEWKARETREARAKRSERRHRGVGAMASRESTIEREILPIPQETEVSASRRSVKFAV
jgi:hypothetical protein